ncbi:MAG: alpha-amylase [Capsulimonas sp.]|uniref:alpha-amylase n=1 Tax=Capsulimonas sp. TaxID=2494211 RepID=UPI003264671F
MSTPNGVMMQFFQWFSPNDGSLWNEMAARSADLAAAGFTALWIPPTMKGSHGVNDVGYAQYDLFDLGEFDQKGAIRTKYGTKSELLAAIAAAHQAGLQVYSDVVFNHKDGADSQEVVWVQSIDQNDRNHVTSDWYQMHAWTRFDFPGRGKQYSSMSWYWWCFDSIGYNADTNTVGLYRLKDKQFSTQVSPEHGNYDYLMADDLDMGVEFVRDELMYWGEWYLETTGVDGFRLDACKHIRSNWFPDWLGHLRAKYGRELFSVGEYWSQSLDDLNKFITDTGGAMSLFDVPLHYTFSQASNAGNSFDMRTILDGSLMQAQPTKAVTFVENHDTQPFQQLFSPVEPWFKPLAYALILLRAEGYPCVFQPDYYGATYFNQHGGPDVQLYSHRFLIDRFIKARQSFGFGDQHDYFDHPNTIGWVRTGDAGHSGAMAVVLTNGAAGSKWMNVYRANAVFTDITGHFPQTITTNSDGWAEFLCPAGSVSVWASQ